MRAASRLRLPLATAVALIGFICLLSSSATAGGSSGDNGYAQTVLDDGPVAFWRLDETGGQTAADSSMTHVYDHDGAYVGLPSSAYASATPPMGGNAVTLSNPFDGPDQRIDINYDSAEELTELNPFTYTLEAWVKPSELPIIGGSAYQPYFKSILCSRQTDLNILPGYHLYIGYYDGAARFSFLAGTNAAPQGDWGAYRFVYDHNHAVETDQWYHVVATNDGTNLHLYVNGQDVTGAQLGSGGTYPPNCFDATHIGACKISGSGNVYLSRYSGSLADIAVYNSVLPLARIQEHHRFGTEGPPPATTPSLGLSSESTSFHTGETVTFTVEAENVSDVDWTKLSAKVTGANAQTISLIEDTDTSAIFSYAGPNPGTDRIIVSGAITGDDGVSYTTSSNSPAVNWLAGATSAESSYGDSGTNPYANVPTCVWGDPVNSVTGNFFETYTDVALPGNGIRFSLERTYNSRDDGLGRLGKGWSTNVLTALAIDESGNVTVEAGAGEKVGFVLQADGSYQGDSNVTAKLTKTSSGYDLLLQDQNVQHFDSEGHLLSWLDPNGQGLRFAYNGDGRLENVTDSGGREVVFVYDSEGRLITVILPDSSTVSYQFEDEFLTSVTDQAGAVTRYVYGDKGFLARAIDPSGTVLFENTYDDSGRVLTQTDPAGNTISFDWSEGTASDPSGTWKDSYTDRNELAKRVDALGNETEYSYNESSEPVSITDPLDNETTMTYDGRGNMLTKTDALGNTESWTYDESNNMLSHTDQLGNTSSYTYDENGNQISEADPLGAVTTHEYDSAGRLIKEVDPLGRVTRSVYDSEGNLIESITPSGATTTYAYDALGRQISETDPLGNTTTSEYDAAGRLVKTTDPLGHSTTSTYDEAGRLVTQTDANGNETSYQYDDAGRQVAVIAPDGATTRSSYNKFDQLTASTDALGRVTSYEYDALGRQVATISPTGVRTETTYDANGNVIDAQDPLGNKTKSVFDELGHEIETTDALGRTTKTVYDAVGNVVKTIDALGNASTTTYDAVGRVVKETDPLGNFTTSSYDAAGQVVAETDANGNTTHHTYDADGQEISVATPSGAVTTSSYDAAGNLIESTDADGHATTYSYDAAGKQISEANPLGARTTHTYDANGNEISTTDPLGHTSTKTYDSMNRLVSSADPLSRTTRTTYDLNGSPVEKIDPLGNITTSEYDTEGRLIKQTDPLGNSITSTYDDAGRLLSKTDANGHATSYVYDAVGQKTSVNAPDGSVTGYEYDANGNVVKRIDANDHETTYTYDTAGNKASKANAIGNTWHFSYDPNGNLKETETPSGGTITQAYDSENRLISKSYSDSTPAVSYTYDPAGNKLSQADGTGTTYYAYDAADRRLSATSPSGAFLYSYDLNGSLLSRTYPNGLKTSYSYNDAGEMVAATVKGKVTRYTHEPNGKLSSTLYPNGILEERTYDTAGHLTGIRGTAPHEKPFYSRSYSYDPVGNPLTQKATAPRKDFKGFWGKKWHKGKGASLAKWTETYSYDSRDRLTKACMNARCSRYYAYSYDAVGNRLSEKTGKAETLYAYDDVDELLSTSEAKPCHREKLTHYSYDQNGNQASEGSTHYAYNLENKLIQVKDKHKEVFYTYTAEGLMATRVARSETTSYSWDTRPDLPELAQETDSNGWGRLVRRDTTSYTYGEGAIGLVNKKGGYAFHTDLLGSVVALSDDRGKLVESYRYTPYGEDYSSNGFDEVGGSELNSIRYAGQYLDSESDLYNMRAREYEPETGRFLEIDPIEAGTGEVYLGVYIYADDQPTLKTDPSGMCVPIEDSLMSPCMRPAWYPTSNNRWNGQGEDPGWSTYSPGYRPSLRFRALAEARSWLGTTGSTNAITSWFKRFTGNSVEGEWCAASVVRWYISAGSKAFKSNGPVRYGGVAMLSSMSLQSGTGLKKTNSPAPGDIVTYSSTYGSTQPGTHTGLFVKMISRNPLKFRTIEGNTTNPKGGDNGVFYRKRIIPGEHDFQTAWFIRVTR